MTNKLILWILSELVLWVLSEPVLWVLFQLIPTLTNEFYIDWV